MKKSRLGLVAIALLVVASPIVASQHAEGSADRQKLLDHLQQTRRDFLAAIDGVSEAQWKYKAAPDKWSIAEVAEHITLSETLIEGMVTDGIAKVTPGEKRSTMTDEKLIAALTNRTTRFQAPEVLKPASKFENKAVLVKAFEEARGKTVAAATEVNGDLRALLFPHPVLGEIDAQQGYLFLSAHTARHIAQIEEVKTSEGYPAK